MALSQRDERRQLALIASTVIALHVIGWGGVFALAGVGHPALIGLAGLAYALGLRHAFDADHIAAIDNITRKLTTQDARPLGVGLYFSLGHSSVVLVMTAVVAMAAQWMTPAMPFLQGWGRLVGTTISGVFLYGIALVNLVVLADTVRVLQASRRGRTTPAGPDGEGRARGILSRCRGVFRIVSRPWHTVLVGALFGLGFDTATEIGLLATAGVAASQALPLAAVLCLPVVFAAGMSMLDAADGVLMCGVYRWSLDNPERRIHYNLSLTGISVVAALVIGTIELVSVAPAVAGYSVIGMVFLTWVTSRQERLQC
ncbi:MAG: HoxN/HupN/NixA family nickel/cobalt transporter [Vicinamibacterales bacterium]